MVLLWDPHQAPVGHGAGGGGQRWPAGCVPVAALIQEGEGFFSRHHPRSIPGAGHTVSRVPGHRARDGMYEEGGRGVPSERRVFTCAWRRPHPSQSLP